MSLLEMLNQNAARPDAGSLIFLDERGQVREQLSWSELAQAVRALSRQLSAEFEPGTRVFLVIDPEPRFAVAFLACLASGLVSLPLPPMEGHRVTIQTAGLQDLSRDSEATYILSAGTSHKLLADQELADLKLWPIPAIADLIQADQGQDSEAPLAADLDQWATMLYTSGSTALPKGVPIRHRHLVYNAETCVAAWQVTTESVLVSWMPNQHSFGLCCNLLLPLLTGCSLVLMAPSTFIGAPRLWFEVIDRYRGTHSGAATFGYQVCSDRVPPSSLAGLDLSSWKVGLVSAEPVRRGTCETFLRNFGSLGLGPDFFCVLYGLSECGPFTSMPAQAPSLFHQSAEMPEELSLACVGPALPGSEIRICLDDSGKEAAPGEVGEVWLAGPSMMDGYFKRDEVNRQAFVRLAASPLPFFRTGDSGFVDESGLYITGRLKELLIIRGKNYAPQDIEWAAINGHPLIKGHTAAAFEDSLGKPTLVIEVTDSSATEDLERIHQGAAAGVNLHLGITIDRWVYVALGTIPKTASGKVRRGPCRQALEGGSLAICFEQVSRQLPRAEVVLADHHSWVDQLRALLAAELGLALEEIDEEAPLSTYQIDSMAVMALSGTLTELTGQTVHPTIFYKSETLSELADLLGRPDEA